MLQKLLTAAIAAAAPKIVEAVIENYGDEINALVTRAVDSIGAAVAAKLPDIGQLDDIAIEVGKRVVDELLERLPFPFGKPR